jgi:hypothetical protein
MSDNYQAVYDAVRSRFNGCDTSQAVESAISNAFSNMYVIPEVVRGCISEVAIEMMRPFFLLKPKMFPDGNMWCALYGENLQEGVAAFGETPAKASVQFDIEWLNQKPLQDQIILREARYKGYKAENLSDNASEEERTAWNEGFNSRGK